MDAFEKACLLVQQGCSVLQSAKKCGMNEGTLRRYMKKNGVTSEGQKILQKSMAQKKRIVALRASGMSYSEIARQTTVFCSGSCSATHRNAQNKTNPQSKTTSTQFKSKLSQEDIVKIFRDCGTYASIATQYNISQATVGFIKNKKIHTSITEDL